MCRKLVKKKWCFEKNQKPFPLIKTLKGTFAWCVVNVRRSKFFFSPAMKIAGKSKLETLSNATHRTSSSSVQNKMLQITQDMQCFPGFTSMWKFHPRWKLRFNRTISFSVHISKQNKCDTKEVLTWKQSSLCPEFVVRSKRKLVSRSRWHEVKSGADPGFLVRRETLSPKLFNIGGFPLKFPENCMILVKSWGQGLPPWIRSRVCHKNRNLVWSPGHTCGFFSYWEKKILQVGTHLMFLD